MIARLLLQNVEIVFKKLRRDKKRILRRYKQGSLESISENSSSSYSDTYTEAEMKTIIKQSDIGYKKEKIEQLLLGFIEKVIKNGTQSLRLESAKIMVQIVDYLEKQNVDNYILKIILNLLHDQESEERVVIGLQLIE